MRDEARSLSSGGGAAAEVVPAARAFFFGGSAAAGSAPGLRPFDGAVAGKVPFASACISSVCSRDSLSTARDL